MSLKILPVYNQFAPENHRTQFYWNLFKRYEPSRNDFSNPDFSVCTQISWRATAEKILSIFAKMVFFPWGVCTLAKALLSRVAMFLIFPAQILFYSSKMEPIRERIKTVFDCPENKDLVGKEIILEKNGHRYAGLLLGNRENLLNEKWALFAPGNGTCIENAFLDGSLNPYFKAGFNVLAVNGPGVGNSDGSATVERLGDAQDVALSFLESAVRAKTIVVAGHSLGAAAIGLAALKHSFKPDVKYLMIRLMTFDRLTQIAAKIQGAVASKILYLLGCEIDCVSASKKLQEKGVHEVVVHGQNDSLMAGVSLLETLKKEGLTENKTMISISEAEHCDLHLVDIPQIIKQWEASLRGRPIPSLVR